MTTLTKLTADELADLANRYTKISTQLFEFRVTHALSPESERLLREEGEQRLDALANILRGRAITLVVEDARLEVAQLHGAIDSARKTLDKIADAKEAVVLVAHLVSLGGAILSGNAKAILKAVKAFRGDDEEEEEEEDEDSA